jgi:hypothetical protein
VRFAPPRSVRERFAPVKSAPKRSDLVRSGTMPGFFSRHAFHVATPFLRVATCSSFATEAPPLGFSLLCGLRRAFERLLRGRQLPSVRSLDLFKLR